MFPQIKLAHRRAEPSGTAHWRAPVIPTSFPATTTTTTTTTTASGSGYLASRRCLQTPRGAQEPSATFSLGPSGASAGSDGGVPPITTDVPGERRGQHPGHRLGDLAVIRQPDIVMSMVRGLVAGSGWV